MSEIFVFYFLMVYENLCLMVVGKYLVSKKSCSLSLYKTTPDDMA